MGGMIGGIAGGLKTQEGLTQAAQQQDKANQMIQDIQNAPDAARPLILQQYRQAGILTPDMEAAISAGPSAMSQVTTNGQGIQAQQDALKQMQDRAATGMTATDRAALAKGMSQSAVAEKAKQDQIMQQFKQMGQGGGTAQLAAQLQAAQGGANENSQNALDIMGKSQQQALQAAAQAGTMGSGLENQQFGEQSAKAQAADQMNRFNTQNQIAAQNANVQAKNQAQGANLANLQNVGNQNVNMANQEAARERAGEQQNFSNQVGLANTKAGSAQNYGNFQANAGAAAGKADADMGSAMDKGVMSMLAFSQGGQVHDYTRGGHVSGKEMVPGDSPANDTVDAKLSPGEIVVPKTLAQSELGDKLLHLLNAHHEIKTHLDGIEKKNKKSKEKQLNPMGFADGGMPSDPYPPGTPDSVKANFSPQEVMAHQQARQQYQMQQPMSPTPMPVQPSLGDKIGANMQMLAQGGPKPGMAHGGQVRGYNSGDLVSYDPDNHDDVFDKPQMDPADKAAGLNMFAPGALDKKPLAQYDDRSMNQMNTDSSTGDKSPDSSGGLADMLAKFKSLGGSSDSSKDKSASAPAPQFTNQPQPFTQAGMSMIAGNRAAMAPQMQAPQANFRMPGMADGGQVQQDNSQSYGQSLDNVSKSSEQRAGDKADAQKKFASNFNKGGKVPDKNSIAYLEHLMSQLNPSKKHYDDGTVNEPGGVVPEQSLDYPAPEIDPALAQGPSQQADMSVPEMSKDDMELPEESESRISAKEKEADADKDIADNFAKESKDREPASEDDDQMEKDLKPDESPDEDEEEESADADKSKEESKPSDKETYTNDELKELQKKRRMMLGLSGLAQAGAMFGGAATHSDSSKNVKAFQDAEKQYDIPIQDFKDLIANQQNDPSSPMSQIVKQYMTSKGFNSPDNASAADLFKVAPFLQKDAALQNALQKVIIQQTVKQQEGEKNRQSREKIAEDAAKGKDLQTAAYRERTKNQLAGPNDRKMQTRFDQYAKALREGGDQSVKLGRQNIVRAKNLFLTNGIDPDIKENQIDKIPDSKLNQVNRINVIENGIELNRLLSGSNQSAQSTLNKLVPNNLNMTATQIQDYMTNRLNPAEQAQALKSYMKIAARARDLNHGVVENYHKQVMPAAKAAFDAFPDQSAALQDEFKNQGFDLSPTKSKGSKQQGAAGMHMPGDLVMVKGKQYKVGADGDSLEPAQ